MPWGKRRLRSARNTSANGWRMFGGWFGPHCFTSPSFTGRVPSGKIISKSWLMQAANCSRRTVARSSMPKILTADYPNDTDRIQSGPKLNGFDSRYPRLSFSGPSLGLGLLKILTADYADDTDRKQTGPKLNGFDPRYPRNPR